MKRLSMLTVRFARRSRQEQKLLLMTALLFGAAHLLLRWSTYDLARRRLQRLAGMSGTRVLTFEQLGWAAATISQHLPGRHSCLIQALCCHALATACGLATELKIGAARAGTAVHFHAWVEYQDRIIYGFDGRAFVPLT